MVRRCATHGSEYHPARPAGPRGVASAPRLRSSFSVERTSTGGTGVSVTSGPRRAGPIGQNPGSLDHTPRTREFGPRPVPSCGGLFSPLPPSICPTQSATRSTALTQAVPGETYRGRGVQRAARAVRRAAGKKTLKPAARSVAERAGPASAIQYLNRISRNLGPGWTAATPTPPPAGNGPTSPSRFSYIIPGANRKQGKQKKRRNQTPPVTARAPD
jgi:hypothetical protein